MNWLNVCVRISDIPFLLETIEILAMQDCTIVVSATITDKIVDDVHIQFSLTKWEFKGPWESSSTLFKFILYTISTFISTKHEQDTTQGV